MSKRLHTNENLTAEALSALRWTYLGFLTRIACSFIAVTLLARLLGPKPFGQVAAASLVVGLANLLADAGFSSALVQAPQLTEQRIRFAFTVQALMGGVMMIVAVLIAPFVAIAFHDPLIRNVLCVLAPLFILQAFGQVSTALLKRKLAFQTVQRAQIGSYVLGYFCVGLPAAYLGAGVWSLIAAQLTQSVSYSSFVYASVRHSVVPCVDRSGIPLLWFGTKVTGASLANWTIDNLDNVVIGRTFGSASLGLYSRAFNLASSAAEGIASACQQVLFASCSRAQGEPARLRRAYLAVVGAIAFITLPLFWSMAVCAQTVVVGLYGAKWSDATQLFMPLALAFPIHALMSLSGPVLGATNHVERELRTQAVAGGVAAVLFVVAAHYSVAAVAWAVLLAYAVRYWVSTTPTLQLLEIQWSDVLRVIRGPVAVAAVTASAVLAVNFVAVSHGIQTPYILAMLAVTGGLTLCLLLGLVTDWVVPEELINPLINVSAKMPVGLSAILRNAAARQARRRERGAAPLGSFVSCGLAGSVPAALPDREEPAVLVADRHEI
jgi:PST family polysaccharide transporter